MPLGVWTQNAVCSAAALAAAVGLGLSQEQRQGPSGEPARPPCAKSRPGNRAQEALFHPTALCNKASSPIWDILYKTADYSASFYTGHSTTKAGTENKVPLLGSRVLSMSDKHMAWECLSTARTGPSVCPPQGSGGTEAGEGGRVLWDS